MKKVLLLSIFYITGSLTFGLNSPDTKNKIPVIFTYQPWLYSLDGETHEVFLAGNFNEWSPNTTLMEEINGVYSVTLYLEPGKYSYKFVVDGKWITDKTAKDFIDDGFGGKNSVTYVGKDDSIKTEHIDSLDIYISGENKIPVSFSYKPLFKETHEVFIAGNFNEWSPNTTLMEEINGVYSVTLYLEPGKYSYKFVVDGSWVADKNAEEFMDDGWLGKNSIIYVSHDMNSNKIQELETTKSEDKQLARELLEIQNNQNKSSDYNEPPKPIIPIKPFYPKNAQAQSIEGTVFVKFYINSNGIVNSQSITIIKGIPELNDAAKNAIYNTKWKPAEKNDKEVGTWLTIPIKFALHN